MAYRFKPGRPPGDQLVRIVREQIRRACSRSADAGVPLAGRVHGARTACKRIRAALRLARATHAALWRRENAFFRDAARGLTRLREAAVLPASLAALLKHFSEDIDPGRFAAVRRQALAHRREVSAGGGRAGRALAEFERRLRAAERRWRKRRLDLEAPDILRAFRDSYRGARRACRALEAGSPAAEFHECRKRIKTHGYHCRLFRCAWPEMMRPLQRELGALGDQLGEEHDLELLGCWLADRAPPACDDPEAARLRGLIAARRAKLRRAALLRGARVFAAKPGAFARQVSAWWETAERRR